MDEKNLSSYLECTICGSILIDPRALECNHLFCLRCLLQLAKHSMNGLSSELKCPMGCSEITHVKNGVSSLKKVHTVTAMCAAARTQCFRRLKQQHEEAVICDWCGKEADDCSMCDRCYSFYCSTCAMKQGAFDHLQVCVHNDPSRFLRLAEQREAELFQVAPHQRHEVSRLEGGVTTTAVSVAVTGESALPIPRTTVVPLERTRGSTSTTSSSYNAAVETGNVEPQLMRSSLYVSNRYTVRRSQSQNRLARVNSQRQESNSPTVVAQRSNATTPNTERDSAELPPFVYPYTTTPDMAVTSAITRICEANNISADEIVTSSSSELQLFRVKCQNVTVSFEETATARSSEVDILCFPGMNSRIPRGDQLSLLKVDLLADAVVQTEVFHAMEQIVSVIQTLSTYMDSIKRLFSSPNGTAQDLIREVLMTHASNLVSDCISFCSHALIPLLLRAEVAGIMLSEGCMFRLRTAWRTTVGLRRTFLAKQTGMLLKLRKRQANWHTVFFLQLFKCIRRLLSQVDRHFGASHNLVDAVNNLHRDYVAYVANDPILQPLTPDSGVDGIGENDEASFETSEDEDDTAPQLRGGNARSMSARSGSRGTVRGGGDDVNGETQNTGDEARPYDPDMCVDIDREAVKLFHDIGESLTRLTNIGHLLAHFLVDNLDSALECCCEEEVVRRRILNAERAHVTKMKNFIRSSHTLRDIFATWETAYVFSCREKKPTETLSVLSRFASLGIWKGFRFANTSQDHWLLRRQLWLLRSGACGESNDSPCDPETMHQILIGRSAEEEMQFAQMMSRTYQLFQLEHDHVLSASSNENADRILLLAQPLFDLLAAIGQDIDSSRSLSQSQSENGTPSEENIHIHLPLPRTPALDASVPSPAAPADQTPHDHATELPATRLVPVCGGRESQVQVDGIQFEDLAVAKNVCEAILASLDEYHKQQVRQQERRRQNPRYHPLLPEGSGAATTLRSHSAEALAHATTHASLLQRFFKWKGTRTCGGTAAGAANSSATTTEDIEDVHEQRFEKMLQTILDIARASTQASSELEKKWFKVCKLAKRNKLNPHSYHSYVSTESSPVYLVNDVEMTEVSPSQEQQQPQQQQQREPRQSGQNTGSAEESNSNQVFTGSLYTASSNAPAVPSGGAGDWFPIHSTSVFNEAFIADEIESLAPTVINDFQLELQPEFDVIGTEAVYMPFYLGKFCIKNSSHDPTKVRWYRFVVNGVSGDVACDELALPLNRKVTRTAGRILGSPSMFVLANLILLVMVKNKKWNVYII